MYKSLFEKLKALLPEECVFFGVSLKNYTTMRVGGKATCLVDAHSTEHVVTVVQAVREENAPLLVIGNGSNMVISDDGFDGVVLYIGKHMSDVCFNGDMIVAEAGALLPVVSKLAAQHSLTGLEFAAGIPGSVGGAVVMNAGAYGGEMKQVLLSVSVYSDGEIKEIAADALNLSYRHSIFMENNWIILSAKLKLAQGNQDEIFALMSDYNGRRREKQPLQYPSSGSFFKRPVGYYAGALIQDAHLKGFSVGGAQVSELHAGFVINTGDATANDIYRLMVHVQNTVHEAFGVHLEPEVHLIGRFDA